MKAPILHGLNAIGIAGRALLHAVGGTSGSGDPGRLRWLEASFAAPGYNGDRLTTQIWRDRAADEIAYIFRVVNQEGVALLERGRARFTEVLTAVEAS
jgi:acyl dehydratase